MSTGPTTAPIVVLVHGAWHGAWCWATLQGALDGRGVPSLAVDLPGHGASTLPPADLVDHAAHVAALVERLDRPVVLVGHSYGGAVVSSVPVRPGCVAAAMFVTAFGLLAGECVNDVVRANPGDDPALRDAITMRDDGTSVLDPALAVEALYGESPDAAVRAALARLGPHRMATFAQPIGTSLIGSTPTTYVRCTLDRAVPLAQQDAVAARCDHTISIAADHSPFLSAVDELADAVVDTVERCTAATLAAPARRGDR